MKILYINHYAGSPNHGMEYRPYYLAKEWVKLGHDVRIISADFSHVRNNQPDIDKLTFSGNANSGHGVIEEIDHIQYVWYKTPSYRGNGIGRLKNIVSFLLKLWIDADFIAKNFSPDVVIASSTYPMDIWVANRIVKYSFLYGKPAKLVFEVHDLWPLSLIEISGMSPKHPFAMLCQAAERFAYRYSDVVISMLGKAEPYMRKNGLLSGKFFYIPNGIALEEWETTPTPLRADIHEYISSQKLQGKTIVGYAGSHGTPNALDTMLRAANLLRDESFSFVLVGDGHEKSFLQRLMSSLNLQNSVKFFDPIPKNQIPTFLSSIDIAYIGWQDVPIYRFGIAPNKLMDYMMGRCIILHSVAAGNDPVAESGCGITVPPIDPVAIANGLRKLNQIDYTERERMRQAGMNFVLQHHTYSILASSFISALNIN